MPSLARNVAIGILAVLCIAGAMLLSTWRTATTRTIDSLAAHLPTDAVLAYAEFPAGAPPDPATLYGVTTSLPPLPDVGSDVVAAAAVRLPDGTVGWMTMRVDEHGASHFDGSLPALSVLLTDTRPPLSHDRTFKDLRFQDGSWTYVTKTSDDASIARLLNTQHAMALTWNDDTITMRFPLRPTPSLPSWVSRPLASLPHALHTILLPPFHAMVRIGPLLSPHARLVIETVSMTFLDSVAPGLSLRYDLPILLDGPSLLQITTNESGTTFFSLEGNGESTVETERILRLMHEKFASAHGGSRTKTVSAEGFSLTTLTPDVGAGTIETTDGPWTILRTDATTVSLMSAHNGTRFALTTDPDALIIPSGEGPSQRFDASSLTWTDAVADHLHPLWPSLLPNGEHLQVRLSNGPGYAEWTLSPLGRP